MHHTVIETEEQDTDVNEQDMEVSFIMMTAALVLAYKEVRLF
jgi:hypothetical protein